MYCPKCGTAVGGAGPAPRPVRRTSVMSPLAIAVLVVAVVLVVGATASAGFLGFFVPFSNIAGSGNQASRAESYSGFTGVELSSGFHFTISRASTFSVVVTTDDNLLDYVQVTMTGSMLSVGLAPGHGYQTTVLKVAIAMPDLTDLELSGGTSGTVTGLSSSGNLVVGSSGGSTVVVGGTASSLQMDVSGGSQVDLSGLHVGDANVNLSGGSQATVNMDGTLNAALSGGSRLFYFGSPKMGAIDTSGGSAITKLG